MAQIQPQVDTSTGVAPRLLTIPAAARLLACGRTVLYEEIKAGRLRTVKRGARRLVPVAALDEYVELLEEATGAPAA
jgi:excisionase family DNA binding protein